MQKVYKKEELIKMAKWYVGTVVCGGCKSLLNIKSISESISCYLCNEMIDLSNCQVIVDDEILTETTNDVQID